MASLGNLLATNSLMPQEPPSGMGPPGAPMRAPVPATVAAPAPSGNPLVGAWKNFITQLQTDPNMRQAMLQTGIGLMRSPQMGQNNWDVAADALSRGTLTLDQLRERDRKRKLEEEDRTFDRDIKTRGVKVAEGNAQVYQRTGNAQADQAEFMNSKEVRDIKMKLLSGELSEQEAGVRLKNAQAAYYGRMPKESASDSDIYGSLFDSGKGGFDVRAAEAIYEDLRTQYPNEKPEVLRRKAYEEQQRRKTDRVNLEQAEARIQDLAKNIAFGIIPASEEDLKNPYQAAARMYREEMKKNRDASGRNSQLPPTPSLTTGQISPTSQQSSVGKMIPVIHGGAQVIGTVVSETPDAVAIKLPDGSTKSVPRAQFNASYGQ